MPGLALAELDEGQLDAPPGLQFVRHGGVGAAFVLFWLLVPCLRGAAACGPARGGAARRGGCGGVVGGCATSGTRFTWRLLLFGANLRNVGAPRMEPLRGNGFFRPGARGDALARPRKRRVPPEGLRGAIAHAAARPQKETRRTGGRRPIGQAILPLPGRCWEGSGQRRNDVGEPAAQPKKTEPCQSLGTHNQAKARKSASDRRCAYNTERAATTITQKARRTQHN